MSGATPPNATSHAYPASLVTAYPHLNFLSLDADQVRKERAAKRKAKRRERTLHRRAARYTPAELAIRDDRKKERERLWISATALLKAESMKREVRRAKRTKIYAENFLIVDIYENLEADDTVRETDGAIKCRKNSSQVETSGNKAFAGQITIEDTISAMRQALSEHTQHGILRLEPGRYSYHVDGAVSLADGLTGLAVVHKTHRQD